MAFFFALIFNSEGEIYISYADLTIAFVDEIVKEQHLRAAFTVSGDKE